MKNEIHLCRGKRLDTKEWITGYHLDGSNMCQGWALICPKLEISTTDCGGEELKPGEFLMGPFVFVDPDTVCRCTGLTDKTGRMVFDKDICKVKEDEFVIEWNSSAAAFQAIGIGRAHGKDSYHLFALEDLATIIGSIFDNPELLEGEG